jgi:hypothetical protein
MKFDVRDCRPNVSYFAWVDTTTNLHETQIRVLACPQTYLSYKRTVYNLTNLECPTFTGKVFKCDEFVAKYSEMYFLARK